MVNQEVTIVMSGEAKFKLGDGSVPSLTPDTIELEMATETNEMYLARLSRERGKFHAAAMTAHFLLEHESGGTE